jgi:hypothetical protein
MVEKVEKVEKKRKKKKVVLKGLPVGKLPKVEGGEGASLQVVFRFYHPRVKQCRNVKGLDGIKVKVPGGKELKELYWKVRKVVGEMEEEWGREEKEVEGE